MPKRGRGETKEASNKKQSNTRANDQANRMERKRHHNGCVDHRAHKRHQPDGADFQERVKQRSAHKKQIRRERYTSIKQHVKRKEALDKHYKEQKQRRQEEAKRRQEEAKQRRKKNYEAAERRRQQALEDLTSGMDQMSINEYNHIYIRF